MNRAPWLVTAMLASVSCGILGPNRERVVGTLGWPGAQGPPSAPDTVAVSIDFAVTLFTVTSGCDRGGETEVRVEEHTAFVTPYDYKLTSGDCGGAALYRNHDTTVRFDVVGQARVVIMARGNDGTPLEFELPVWVR